MGVHAIKTLDNDHTPLGNAFDHLNPEQRDAVLHTEGPVLVLAGAGTGKTRVLTHRIAHILESGLANPWEILAVTFTNKAAAEMKHRVQTHLQRSSIEAMPLGTFHALCTKMLRRHIELLGYSSNFTIMDSDDQQRLLRQIIQAEGVDTSRYTPKLVSIVINRWKDRAWLPEQAAKGDLRADRTILMIYNVYQERLKTLNVVDFGDLLLLTIQLFQHHPDVLKHYHQQLRYIMVDEYQDTNIAQYLWLRLLAQGTDNVCCVGDDDQSIYGWRGAEVGNILRFEEDFKGAKLIRLERNYRSTGHILGAASALISYNKGRLGKTLHSEYGDGEKVIVKACWNCEDEARYIGDEIEHHQRQGSHLTSMAVLVRAGFQTRQFEERFMTMGIPYRVIGGLRFYERAEIRDALAYLRLVVQESDALAFERIVNLPRRGIGQTTINLFHQVAREEGISLPKAARMLMETRLIKGGARTGLSEFFTQLDRWQDNLDTMSASALTSLILDESGYVMMWRNDPGPDAPQRLENLKELVRAVSEFDNLQGFLEHVSLVLDTTSSSNEDMVNIMTLHGAKGLEFDTVFLPGWEDGLFPHARSLEDEDGLEEERRLAYVGLTRARNRAYITYTGFRRMPQGGKPSYPSQFVHELPKEHTKRIHTNGIVDEGNGGRWTSFNNPTPPQSPSFATKTPSLSWSNRSSTSPKVLRPSHAFKQNDRVFHQKFGYGNIQSVEGDKLVIAFDTSGLKNVMADFVEKE